MRRAVVFIGGSRDIVSALQLALADALPRLADAGILVPVAGRGTTGRGAVSHKGLVAPAQPAWADLRAEVAGSSAETVLLVVPAWLRVVDRAAQRGILEELSTLADEIVIVSVVGDQLTLINEHYLHVVGVWRSSARLDALALRFLSNALFAHETMLRPWYEQDTARYVAVSYDDYRSHNPLEVVLGAGGVTFAEHLEPSAAPVMLGPVGVEANRLLATYLRSKVPDLKSDSKPVVAASRVALARAEKQGWCVRPFWGWSAETAEQTVAHFEAGNNQFAQAVWGTDWPIDYPLGRRNKQLDLLDLEAEIIEHVHQYVMTMSDKLVPVLKGKR